MVVNSEKIFKSIPAYTKAIEELDALAAQYQKQVDQKFNAIEELYVDYQQNRDGLSRADRETYEKLILDEEKQAQKFREELFGKQGTLMNKRMELIQPIQKRVFALIEEYAKNAGADLVIDSSNNPSLLYNTPKAEHTQQIIDLLKK